MLKLSRNPSSVQLLALPIKLSVIKDVVVVVVTSLRRNLMKRVLGAVTLCICGVWQGEKSSLSHVVRLIVRNAITQVR